MIFWALYPILILFRVRSTILKWQKKCREQLKRTPGAISSKKNAAHIKGGGTGSMQRESEGRRRQEGRKPRWMKCRVYGVRVQLFASPSSLA
jgi:hypothetical protein